MTDKTPRQRGATVRAAIDRLTASQLLTMAEEIDTALVALNGGLPINAELLNTFHGVAVLALRVAFGVGGNGAGKPHSALPIKSPHAQEALEEAAGHGIRFRKAGDESAPFLPA